MIKNKEVFALLSHYLNHASDYVEREITHCLGLGYYAYMVSEKENVDQVTVVESNENVIRLLKKYVLPQFTDKEKIRIICVYAFHYAETDMQKEKYDFVFSDLWHDVGNGIELYLKMKEYEKLSLNMTYSYWIEKSILCYL